MNIDELGLVAVEKANSKTTTGGEKVKAEKAPREVFQLRRTKVKNGDRFTFTKEFFTESGLEINSAKQFVTADAVFIAVMPGNSGVFLKNTNKGEKKGRGFKNDELAAALDARSITNTRFKVEFVGEKENQKYYKLVGLAERPKKVKKAKETADAAQADIAPAPGIAQEPQVVSAQ